MPERPFRLFSQAQLAVLSTALAAIANEWARGWGIPAAAVAVSVEAASALVDRKTGAEDDWRERWNHTHGTIWSTWSPEAPAEVARQVFPADGTYARREGGTSMANVAGEAAFDDLLARLKRGCVAGDAAVIPLQTLDASWAKQGSGFVLAKVQFGRTALRLMFDAESARRLAGASAARALPPLGKVALGGSLGAAPIKLQVKAGEVEIGAGTLLTIGVGDVIAIDTKVDEPFSVSLPGGERVCSGFIGRTGELLAVEIMK